MAKGSNPQRQRKVVCPTCKGNMWVYPERAKVDPEGNVSTVKNEEVCGTCNGSGWIDP